MIEWGKIKKFDPSYIQNFEVNRRKIGRFHTKIRVMYASSFIKIPYGGVQITNKLLEMTWNVRVSFWDVTQLRTKLWLGITWDYVPQLPSRGHLIKDRSSHEQKLKQSRSTI